MLIIDRKSWNGLQFLKHDLLMYGVHYVTQSKALGALCYILMDCIMLQ